MIDKINSIEELVNKYPESISFLSEHGIRCIRCGEPIWGTIETAAKEKGFSIEMIDELVKKLNEYIKQ